MSNIRFMKKKIKSSLSPLQRKKLTRVLFVLVFAALGWLLFAPNMGVIPVYQEHKRLEALQQQKTRLEEENAELRLEIDKIQNDIDHFERLAREKYGLLKKEEVLFDFSKEKKKKD